MPDTTASIAAKGCNGTGITEDIASSLHDQLGKKLIAVVELVADSRTERRDGKEKVLLSILAIEPAVDQVAEEHLRNLSRAMFMNRRLTADDQQLQIDTRDDLEPTVEQVVKANPGLLPHPYIAATLDGECDACGNPETDRLHHVTLDQLPDPFTVPAQPNGNSEDEEDDDTDEDPNS